MEFSELETSLSQDHNHMGLGHGQDLDPLDLSGSDVHGDADGFIDVVDQIKLETMDSDSETEELLHVSSSSKLSLRLRKPTKPVTKKDSSGPKKEKKTARKLTSKAKGKKPSEIGKTKIDSKILRKQSSCPSTSTSKNVDSNIKHLLSEYCETNCTICDELILRLSQHFTSHSRQNENQNSPYTAEPEDFMDFQDDGQVSVEIPGIKIEQEQDTVDTEKSSEPRRSVRERRLIGHKTNPNYNSDSDIDAAAPARKKMKKKRKYKTRVRCPICLRGFVHQVTLDEHLKTHAQEFKPPDNPQSEIMGIARTYLNPKTRIEIENPPKTSGNWNTNVKMENTMAMSCPRCPAKFFKDAKLEKHLKDAHDPNKILYPCNSCPALFSSTNKLCRHFKASHPSVDPFICTICKQGFKHLCLLRGHVFTHHEREDIGGSTSTSTSDMGKPFKCTFSPDCTKTYLFQRELDNHVRTVHTGETPFICSTCGKRLTTRRGLIRHEATHRRDKPFVCTICGASFRMKKYLDNHALVHTGEKPHVCDQCGKSFALRTTLRTHYRSHTGEKIYNCKDCGEAFTFRTGLRDHIKRLHSFN